MIYTITPATPHDIHIYTPSSATFDPTQKYHLLCFSDGSGNWKTKVGGFGLACYLVSPESKQLSGGDYNHLLKGKVPFIQRFRGFKNTTNSRMELLGFIEGLKVCKEAPENVLTMEIISDSQYCTNIINAGWGKQWEEKSWYNVKNVDLVQHYLYYYNLLKDKNLEIVHVRGHRGIIGNEKADELATHSLKNPFKLWDSPENLTKYIKS